MNSNANLHKANADKRDEFYTQLSDVANALMHYKEHFRGKVVYCNCDDPAWSAFWEYFHTNFAQLGLKKLISTHYDSTTPTYKMEYAGGNDNDIAVGIKTPLEDNGDFRNIECIDILEESDIVVTNPPFSLFREYIAQLVQYEKKFFIVGNLNAISYKEFFPLLKANKVWLGCGQTAMTFRLSDDYEVRGNSYVGEDGHKYTTMHNCVWYTNLARKTLPKKLILRKKYSPKNYQSYDNYDAINVDKVADIPCDYDGAIGVPITFMYVYNPEQFEIIGMLDGIIDVRETYKRILIHRKETK